MSDEQEPQQSGPPHSASSAASDQGEAASQPRTEGKPEASNADPSATPEKERRVRSFVRRAGRLTPAQAKALEQLLPRYGVPDDPHLISTESCFGHAGPLVLEIGFGNGEALMWMAQHQPAHGFIGLEVHRPGVGHVLRAIDKAGLSNVRVMEADAVEVLRDRISPHSLNGLRIYFPDPWHKKRHNKRRLIQAAFVELAVSRLQQGGVLHLATDWEPYAEQMMAVCSAAPKLVNEAGPGRFAARPEWRPITHFERRGQRLGHGVWDLLFRREVSV